ncbi:Xaa-Pro aminopeptidase [Nocardioides panzhihuensis]|uniref:Xaa-Pro aminopeptidase n=1 Tax=Nocardioides panzhihuensis TaxID=860243 RepID=A0A7Z0DMQ0_9ACTN|nr:Xaa-Pro aminopeptidase [Nocardioides panzhihuensis]
MRGQTWPTRRRIKAGDILSFTCFPTVAGYGTALRRTLFLGEPDARALQTWATNLNIRQHALEVIRPGTTCRKIERELDETRADHSWRHLSDRNHRVRLLAHPYGPWAGRETIRDLDIALEPGMLVSLRVTSAVAQHEPGAGVYGDTDVLFVNETGAELLTAFPAGPEHNLLTG